MLIFHIAVFAKSLSQTTSTKGNVSCERLLQEFIMRDRIHPIFVPSWFAASKLCYEFPFLSLDETSCAIKGESHPVNSSFITSDCTLQCYCMMGGVASCMDLCPQISSECPPGTTLKEQEEQASSGGTRCFCKRKFCVSSKQGNLASLLASAFSMCMTVSTALYVGLGIITICSWPVFPNNKIPVMPSLLSLSTK